MPCGLTLAEGLDESMMDRIGGVAGRFETSSQTFCFPVHRQNVGVLAGYGKEMQDISLHVVRISLVLWAMYKLVESLFRLRADGKGKRQSNCLVTVSCMR